MGSGVSKEGLEDINVVIIGAGYGGVQAAATLRSFGVSFTIIDPKEYFHHCVGSLRASVFPEYAEKVAIPLKLAFGDKFRQGKVTKLDAENKRVYLESGDELSFTHCVIAVGSTGPVPLRSTQLTIAGLMSEYAEISKQLSQAKHIAVVGAGPVGVELVGEIRDKYKEVEITLVSSTDKLVSPAFPDTFQTNIKYLLQYSNIKVEYGRVTNLPSLQTNIVMNQTLELSTGASVHVDLVLSCIGLPPNGESVSQLAPGTSQEQNRIKVNEYLEVEGYTYIYSIGDCCNTAEDKMAAYADGHGQLVGNNIVNQAQGRPLTPWTRKFVGMLVPVGRYQGAGHINGWNVPSFLVRLAKGDLFTAKFWTNVGLKAPA